MNKEKNSKAFNDDVEMYKGIWESEGNKENSLIINLILVGLISSDNIITKQDSINAKREFIKIKEALDKVENISDEKRKRYINRIDYCIKICEQDIEVLPD